MKIICTQENLKNGLQIVGRIIGNSNTLPILNNVLLKTENGLLKLVGTNLELAVTTLIRCKVDQEGSISVPAKTFTELVNNLPNTNITLEEVKGEVQLRTDHYSTKLKTLPSEEFPLIPTVEGGAELVAQAEDLKNSLDQVVFAASSSETQPEISGILFQPNGNTLKLVATDRYRLAEKRASLVRSVPASMMIVPQKTATELSRLLTNQTGEVVMVVTENQIVVTVQDSQLISRLVDGQYPDYDQIIPSSFNATVLVERNLLTAALKTSGIFSKGAGSVTMGYDLDKQHVVISANSHDIGESTVDVPAEVSGTSGSVMLNYRYVLDALAATTAPAVTIKIVDENAPVIFVPQGDSLYMYLVMPIKG